MKRSNKSPLWRRPVASEVDEELEMHLELRTQEYVAEGLSPEEARRKALERFGDVDRHAAECRREAGVRNRRWRLTTWLDELRQDLRFAGRQLRRRPGMALLLVGMLAVGIGLTGTVAGMVHHALFESLPYGESDRLVTLWEEQASRGTAGSGLNVVGPANFMAFRDAEQLEGIAGFITVSANLAGDEGAPVRAKLRAVTDGYFDLLGVAPVRGRTFEPEDATEDAGDVVILSHGLWQQRFGGRHDVVGQILSVNGEPCEIVGVMPPEAALDMGPARAPYGDAADLWTPLTVSERWATARGRWLMVIGRLSPEAPSAESASSEIAGIMERQRAAMPDFNAGWTAHVVPAADYLRAPLRLPLGALAGAVLVVLLIVCINASSLLLSRNLSRRDEMQLRRALGAGRGRLSRQLLAEGVVVAAAAGVAGTFLAGRLQTLAAATLPPHLASSATAPAWWIWPATLGATAVVVLVFAWLPGIWRLGRVRSSRALGGARGQHRLRAALVFAQTALALVLLVGSALMLQTVRGLLDVDPGFDTDGIVSFGVSLPRSTERERAMSFFDDLLRDLEALPGVETVGGVSAVPMAGVGAGTSFVPTDRPEPEPGQRPVADIRVIRGDYFDALGIERLAGRTFDSSDAADREIGSVVVGRSLAEEYWGEASAALGRELQVNWGDPERVRTIVGVVDDVRHADPGTSPRAAIYFPLEQEPESNLGLVLRTERDLETLAPEIRSTVAALDPTVPVYDLHTVREIVRGTLADRQFLSRVITAFAALAFLLSVLGIYGVTSLSVTESRQEVGLRMALGARPWEVVALFVRRVAVWTSGALVVGLAASIIAARAAQGLFFEVRATDPAVLVGVALLVAASALVAAAIPARRAARVDPSHTLRWE